MSNVPAAPGSSYNPEMFGNMSDQQLQMAISHLAHQANRPEQSYSTPAAAKVYQKNLQTWTTTTTPSRTGQRPSRSRPARGSTLATSSTAQNYPYQPLPPQLPTLPVVQPNPPRSVLPTAVQALTTTYPSRLRTGTTLLMQPILSAASVTATRTATRRGGVVNYTDPGSGDELPDAGALESDDSDFIASGGTRTQIRQSRARYQPGINVFSSTTGHSSAPQPFIPVTPARVESKELDQSYLGSVAPSRFVRAKPVVPILHEPPSQTELEKQARKLVSLIPIRVEFETETHRIRDCFVWNLHEKLTKPETFAEIFCNDLDLPLAPWAETVTNQIRAQIEEHEGVASMELGGEGAMDPDSAEGDEIPECRVILSIDVQIATHHLMDHIEWDLLSPLTPEVFAKTLCADLGLSGEALPLVAHAIHEELVKHKKDAIEWGVIGNEVSTLDDNSNDRDKVKERVVGMVVPKDKTGLGLGWGRTPKDGRGPKQLKSVWRDWVEAEEFRTKFEVLTAEEVDRREVERERASRRLRRETSKFQTSTRSRRR